MPRFNSNPQKFLLAGNEAIPATDASTNDDIQIWPLTIAQFVQGQLTIATGSTQGVVSGPNGDKLRGLPTATEINATNADLAEVAIPVFVGAPANGFVALYQHCITVPWQLTLAISAVSAGSTNLTILKNGSSLVGFTSIPVTTAGITSTASGDPTTETFNQNDVLGVNFAGTTGNCANLRCSIAATALIS